MLEEENTQDCNEEISFEAILYRDEEVRITKSGESSNFITTGLVRGCVYDCPFCTIKSEYPTRELQASRSADNLIKAISKHVEELPWPKVPDHTHPRLYTYDIGYFCDIGFDYSHNNIQYNKLFNFIVDHPKIMGVFSTKKIEFDLLHLQVNNKLRILFSIIPRPYHILLEKGTSSIEERINACDSFMLSGWEVGFMLSPLVITGGYITEYTTLFRTLDTYIYENNDGKYLIDIKFLEVDKRKLAKIEDIRVREIIYNPSIQEQSKDNPNIISYRSGSKELFSKQIRRLIEQYAHMEVRYIS